MLTSFLVVYTLLLLAGCAFQRKMLYYPQPLTLDHAIQEARGAGFYPWEDADGNLIGWRMTSSVPARASVLIVHGNAGWAAQRSYMARPIQDLGGLDVHVLEYPGYGPREGSPSLKSLLAAVEGAMSVLPTNRPVYVVSESIGTGVAAHAARTFPDRIEGMALLAPYNNLASVAQAHMPWLLPKLILRDRYHPAQWLEKYRGPIVFLIAGRDEIIPPRFGRALYEGYEGPKHLLEIPDARHNDIAEQTTDWWRDVQSFWTGHARKP